MKTGAMKIEHLKFNIPELFVKINSALAIITTICLLFLTAAFSQGAAFLIDLAARRGQSASAAQPDKAFTVTNLNEDDAARLRRATASRQNANRHMSKAPAEITATLRGNPFINFENGKALATDSRNLLTAEKPTALASADFDADGVPDLAAAYASARGGIISIWRGNIESIFPPSADAQPAPFFGEAREFEIPLAPEFLASGDFDADGHADLLATGRGVDALVLFAGNGDGNFAAPQIVSLKGEITAVAVGEINNFDNLADVALGIIEKGKPKVLIFQSRSGAFSAQPEVLEISKTATAFAFGELDAHAARDLAAASGDELILISGRADNETSEIAPERISRRKFDFQIAALAVGDFAAASENELAILSKDGGLCLTNPLAGNGECRQPIDLPAVAQGSDLMLAAKVSTSQKADLIIGGVNNLNIATSDGADNLWLAASFQTSSAPVAVLPMRLNKDALADLVVLTENALEPSVLLTAPTAVRTVSNANNGGSGSLRSAIEAANDNPGLDEIRFAISNPNSPVATQTDLPAITDATTLDATTQNGFGGAPLIEISVQASGSRSTPMFKITGGNSVLRGFIVNAASAQANIVELSGIGNNFLEGNFIGTNRAGTDSSGAAKNGVLINNISGNRIGGTVAQARNVISGANEPPEAKYATDLMPVYGDLGKPSGVRIAGSGAGNNLVLGNYIGTSKTGLQAIPNAGAGVVIETAASGNRVGGATDSERNVISGNGFVGVAIAPPAGSFSDAVIENNFIGTNKNGNLALGNGSGGIYLEYAAGGNPTATAQIFDNVISGNAGDGVYSVNNPLPPESNAAPEGGVSFLIDLARRSARSSIMTENGLIPAGNKIGTNAEGTARLPNAGNGINLENVPAKIEGNIISGNNANGIKSVSQPSASDFSQIADNFIGLGAGPGASVDLYNAGDGINLEFNGDAPPAIQSTKIWNNVIAGNRGDGVEVSAQSVVWNGSAAPEGGISFLIDLAARRNNLGSVSPDAPSGNRIGTNSDGTAAVPNRGNGILLKNVPALVENNLISANGASGIRANPPISTFLPFEIANNYIGTDATGNVDLGNTDDGITLEYNGVVSGDAPKTSDILSNVISGNNGNGVRIFGDITFNNSLASVAAPKNNAMPRTSTFLPGTGRNAQNASLSNASKSGNAMPRTAFFLPSISRQTANYGWRTAPENAPAGNRIGTNAAGTAPLGNSGHGISVSGVKTKIGGELPADGNLIAHNGGNGVNIASIQDQTARTGNLILNNSIFSNAGLEIDLGGDGLTPNDLLDLDTGANNLQNFPVLTSASSNGASTTVSGTINTTPNTDLTIQFYASLNSLGGQGGALLGKLGGVRTDSGGNASFSATFPVGTPVGHFISASATTDETNVGNENNTSEISPGVAVLGPTAAAVTVAGRVLSANRPVPNAIVTLTDANGAMRHVLTNAFGHYRFAGVAVGETYVFDIRSKRYTFAARVVSVTEEIENLNFTAEP